MSNNIPRFGVFGNDDYSHGFFSNNHANKKLDTNKYYEILGVDKNCSQKDITKAFRKLATEHHPDKGGDINKFQELSNANDILSDPYKRELQNKGGEDAVKEGHAHGGYHDIFDILSGIGGGQRKNVNQKMKDCVHELSVTLEDIMNGKTKKLAIIRDRLCNKCNGQGGEGVSQCDKCEGSGLITKLIQIGASIYSQSTIHCSDCNGEGETVSKRCIKCNGKKVCKEKKIIEVYIDKGVTDKYQYRFYGESDEFPGQQAGDIIIQVAEKPHNIFKRKQADLAMIIKITLKEALCGFKRVIDHLDGKKHVMQTEPGSIIGPGNVKTIMYAGLPLFRNPALTGNLFVHFEIKFPKSGSLAEQQISMLKKLPIGELNKAQVGEDVECHHLIEFEKSHINKNIKQRESEAYDEDDEFEGLNDESKKVVNCANQ